MMKKKNEISTYPELDISSINNADSFVTIIFPKSRSSSYPMAVSMAKLANIYREGDWMGKQYHLSSYGGEAPQLSIASKVCSLLSGIKGVMSFVRGAREIQAYQLASILSCYSDSLFANDQQAYCNAISCASNWRMIIPCHLLSGWESHIVDISDSPLDEKIQALAVRRSCDWCPNFHPGNAKIIL